MRNFVNKQRKQIIKKIKTYKIKKIQWEEHLNIVKPVS